MDLLLELLLDLLLVVLLLLLLLLLLYVFYHVHIGGREAPPLYLRNEYIQQKQQQHLQKQLQQQLQQQHLCLNKIIFGPQQKKFAWCTLPSYLN